MLRISHPPKKSGPLFWGVWGGGVKFQDTFKIQPITEGFGGLYEISRNYYFVKFREKFIKIGAKNVDFEQK